jgi:F-type H+-transporting ATPase subunit epsilon/F-type H+-transporting ATPase subunit delta
MSDKFTVEIISPDQTILKQQTNEVIIPSFEGQMGILSNHIPLITFLRPGIITIKAEGEKKYYVEEGTVEFSNNNLLILTLTARDIAHLDKSKINKLLQKAEANLNTQSTDKDRYLASYKLETLKEISQ